MSHKHSCLIPQFTFNLKTHSHHHLWINLSMFTCNSFFPQVVSRFAGSLNEISWFEMSCKTWNGIWISWSTSQCYVVKCYNLLLLGLRCSVGSLLQISFGVAQQSHSGACTLKSLHILCIFLVENFNLLLSVLRIEIIQATHSVWGNWLNDLSDIRFIVKKWW